LLLLAGLAVRDVRPRFPLSLEDFVFHHT